jgi:uncharacterized protein (TIGR03067 family)
MKYFSSLLVFLFLVFASGCATQLEKDTAALQGTWLFSFMEKEGAASRRYKTEAIRLVISGNQFTVLENGRVIGTGTYALVINERKLSYINARFQNKKAAGTYAFFGENWVAFFVNVHDGDFVFATFNNSESWYTDAAQNGVEVAMLQRVIQ